jgi:dual specificity phosphatase 3
MDPVKLKKLGFTHILNAAEGRKFGQINTSATYYEEAGIKYLGFSIIDNPTYQIGMHFEEAIQFLEDALNDKKSRRPSQPIDL